MRTIRRPKNLVESLENRCLLSATVSPPYFIVDPGATTWPAEHEFFPGIYSTNPSIQYSLLNAPKGMTITEQTNSYEPTLVWTPAESQVGIYKVTVIGTNSAGTLKVPFSIQVTPNVPELYDYFVPPLGEVATPYGVVGVQSMIQVTDSSGEPSTFSLAAAPAGVAINPSTGLVSWTPTATEAGSTQIIVQAKNKFGKSNLAITFPTYTAPAVTDLVVKTDGLNAPTVSWTQPTNSLEKIAGYNIVLDTFGPNGETKYSFDRSSNATSFQLQGLPKGDYEFIPTVTPKDAAGHRGLSTTGSPFEYAAGTPVLTVTQSNIAQAGGFVSLQLNYSDTSSAPAFALVSGPAAAHFFPDSGTIWWNPTNAEVGTQTFVFSDTNAWGTITKSVQIVVEPPVPYYVTGLWVSDVTSTDFTLHWAPQADAQFISGYTIYVSYGPGSESFSASSNVSAGATSFHFSSPNLGTFAAKISAFNSLGQQSGWSQWASAGTTIYNPTN